MSKIVYKELVANISQHPNYDKALAKVKYTAPVIVVDGETINLQKDEYTEDN